MVNTAMSVGSKVSWTTSGLLVVLVQPSDTAMERTPPQMKSPEGGKGVPGTWTRDTFGEGEYREALLLDSQWFPLCG